MSSGAPSMSRVKRSIALAAAAGAALALVAVIAVISLTVRRTGDGSDPDRAFSATETVPEALAAELTWLADADDLVRVVEPTTRELLASAWLRANDALARAADGDLGGLDVWFTDAAREQALARFAGDVTVDPVLSHALRVDFYSLDGQVVTLTADLSVRRDDTTGVETVQAILVLNDGNWRIRNLERVEQR